LIFSDAVRLTPIGGGTGTGRTRSDALEQFAAIGGSQRKFQ
jgi:hypothetical protein